MQGDRNTLIENLFFDQFDKAKKQILYGLKEDSEIYNDRLNDLIKSWVKDKKYITKRLVAYWKRRKRGCIIIIDNT